MNFSSTRYRATIPATLRNGLDSVVALELVGTMAAEGAPQLLEMVPGAMGRWADVSEISD